VTDRACAAAHRNSRYTDVAFAGQSEGFRRPNRARVAEEFAEDVGEEIREQIGFLEVIRVAGGDEISPMLESGLRVHHPLRQVGGPLLLADDLRMQEQFGCDGHAFSGA